MRLRLLALLVAFAFGLLWVALGAAAQHTPVERCCTPESKVKPEQRYPRPSLEGQQRTQRIIPEGTGRTFVGPRRCVILC